MSALDSMMAALSALMSSNNDERRAAEAFYNTQLESNPPSTIECLITIFSSTTSAFMIRSLAGVLLRRAVEKYTKSMDSAMNAALRSKLLSLWTSENDGMLLKRLAHVLAQSATESTWADLLPCIISHANVSGSSSVLVSSLSLVEVVAEYCPDDIQSQLPVVGSFLGTQIGNTDIKVQVACARSAGACIMALEDDNARNSFKTALQPIINVLGGALSRGDEADAVSIMENLVAVAQIQPIFFKGAIDGVVSAMLTVAGSDGLEFPTRSLALELVVTLTETAPALARRCTGLVEGLVPLSMTLALEVEEEEEEWVRGVYSEEAVDENCSVGEEAIERAAAGMGGRIVAPLVLTHVQKFMANADWKYRRAAVAGMLRLAEGATKDFKQFLPQAVQLLGSALADTSARVKFEAIQAIGRFASLFPASLSDLVHAFLPALTAFLGSPAGAICERVRGHAASAIINLINPDTCDADALKDHLEPLLSALVVCLQTASVEVQPPCLVVLGCAAQVSEEAFAPYYASFVPGIKAIIRNAAAPELSILRGKAMECAGLVGEAVGAEVFANDALEIMQLLLGAMGQDDDTTFDYILPACARIAKALKAHFEPFLALVMSPLLAGATQEIQFSMIDAEEDDAEGEVVRDEESNTESTVISLGAGVRKRVTLNTHAVQQKNQAARMLFEFASCMKGHLKSYLSPCLQAALKMVTDKHSADIRSSAILAVAKLFEAYIQATQMGLVTSQELSTLMNTCMSKLQESLKGEINATARSCAAEALRDVLAACYATGVELPEGGRVNFLCRPDEPSSLALTKDILKRAGESISRRAEKEAAFHRNEGMEAEDHEGISEELEEEEELLSQLVDAVGHLLKLYGPQFMPVFDQLVVPAFAPYLAAEQPETLQAIAVCLIDDALEFGGVDNAAKYYPQALATFARTMKSEDIVLRQSSVYGLAQIARLAPQALAPQANVFVSELVAIITHPEARDDDREGVTENALFTLGSIATLPTYREAQYGLQATPTQLSSLWLKNLPLKIDDQIAKLAHCQLCTAVERGDVAVLGEGMANLPELMRIFSEILVTVPSSSLSHSSSSGEAKDQSSPSSSTSKVHDDDDDTPCLAHPHTVTRMQQLVKQLWQSAGVAPDQVKSVCGHLSTEQQRVLEIM